MSNANRLLTHHVVIGETRDGLSQRHLSLCGPSEADGANVMKACQTIHVLASDIAALLPSKHPVLSLVARDIEERIAGIARTLQKISEAIADTSTEICTQDVQGWAAELCDDAVLTAMSYYDLGDKTEIFSQSMKAVRAVRMQPNGEQAAAG